MDYFIMVCGISYIAYLIFKQPTQIKNKYCPFKDKENNCLSPNWNICKYSNPELEYDTVWCLLD